MSLNDEEKPPTAHDPARPYSWDIVKERIGDYFATEPIKVAVFKDIEERDAMGTAKYGTRLQSGNGRDALVDLYQEALDCVVYSATAIDDHQRFGKNDVQTYYALREVYRAAMRNMFAIREIIYYRDGK